MTTDQHISKVEKDVNEIKSQIVGMDKELSDIKGSVNTILQLVQKMDVGLYGDAKNRYVGVIDKQSSLEKEIEELKSQIRDIHKKNNDQDLEIRTKKSLKSEIVDFVKDLVKWTINIIIIYFILKGVIGADTLLKI